MKEYLAKKAFKMAENNKNIKKSKRGEKFEKNPFVDNNLIKTRTKRITDKTGEMMVINRDGGEVVAQIAGWWRAEEVDSEKFVKLFINGVKQFKELTGAGTKVFELLYLEVQKNIGKDGIWLTFPSIDQTSNHIGETTFYRGMKELITKRFIAESNTPGKYWLNPEFMWNGDRIDFLRTYYKNGAKPKEFNLENSYKEERETLNISQNKNQED